MAINNIRTRFVAGDMQIYDDATGTTIMVINDNLEVDVANAGKLKYAGTAITATATQLNTTASLTATATELNQYCVTAYQADAGTAGSVFVTCPHAGVIASLSVVPYAINTTTKTVFTAEIATVLVTAPAWELAINAAAGAAVTVVPTATCTVTAGQVLELISDGGTDATMPVMFTVTITR